MWHVTTPLQVRHEAAQLFKRHDRTSRYSEWPRLKDDLRALALPASAEQHLAVHARMLRSFKVFQR